MNKKQDIRYDEFGEEIIFEMKHKIFLFDWISYLFLFMGSILILNNIPK